MAIDPNVVKEGVVIDKVTGIYGKNKLIAFMTSAKGTGATSMATTELFTLNDDGSYNATISTDYNTVKTINCEPGTYRFTGTKQNDANTTIIIINGNNYNWPALTPSFSFAFEVTDTSFTWNKSNSAIIPFMGFFKIN